jgi:hypothetical protein
MNREELLQHFYPNGDISKRSTQDISRYTTYKDDIISLTSFLHISTTPQTRLFYIKTNTLSEQLCKSPECNNQVSPGRKNTFQTFCSHSCQKKYNVGFTKSNHKRHIEARELTEASRCDICDKQLKYISKEQQFRCTNFACKINRYRCGCGFSNSELVVL